MTEEKENLPGTAQTRLEELLEQLHQVRCGLRSYYESEPEQELLFRDYFDVEHCLSEATFGIGNLIGMSAVCRVCNTPS
ncbi:hypothetical protein [Rurimicrobium arvi]|uniref:DUF86 domain-containing protein n=1 Tax=Rurimicrobium arvi TaxID=2049916 RepID=A0ABP8MZZ3_9BACT